MLLWMLVLKPKCGYNPISSTSLKESGFTYVALGHIHKPMYEEGNMVYPGSMISFGFDELGERGMLDVEIDENHNVKKTFIKLDERSFEEFNLEITEIISEEELAERINALELEDSKMYKIRLVGFKNFEININRIAKMIFQDNIIKIKDYSKLGQDINKIAEESSLKGFFVKELLDKYSAGEIDEDTMEKAIEVGLEVL